MNYPLAVPSGHKNLQKLRLTEMNNVGMSVSPFSFSQQLYDWQGDSWMLDGALPPLKLADAEAWIAFLGSLRGRRGTFLGTDTAHKLAQGNISGCAPYSYNLKALNQARSETLKVAGLVASRAGVLKAGDYIEVSRNYIRNTYIAGTLMEDWTLVGGATVVAGTGSWARLAFPSKAGDGFIGATLILNPINMVSTFRFAFTIRAVTSAAAIEIVINDYPSTGVNLILSPTVPTTDTNYVLTGTLATTAPQIQLQFRTPFTGATTARTIEIYSGSLTIPRVDCCLHKCLNDLDSDSGLSPALPDSSGSGTIDIFPRLRTQPGPGDPVYFTNYNGLFRLSGNKTQWDIDQAKVYGISFSAVESL